MVIAYCDQLFIMDEPVKFLGTIPVNEVAGSPTTISWQELNQPIHLSGAKTVLKKIQRGQVFIGNISSISYEVESFGRLFTYQAISYYDQLTNETISRSFQSTQEGVIELKGSLDDVISFALAESGAAPFVGPAIFRIDTQVETNVKSPNYGAMVLGEKLYVEVLVDNLYMKDTLDAICTQLKLSWHVRAKDGRLVIYQPFPTNTKLANAPFNIDLSLVCPANGQVLSPLKVSPTPPKISKSIVHGVRSLGRRAPEFEEVFRRTKEDIPPDSVRKEYSLLEEVSEVIRVNIAENVCKNLTIDPFFASYGLDGGEGSFEVLVGDDCSWRVSTEATWITSITPTSGSGDGVVSYSVAMNDAEMRTAPILVKGMSISVNHAVAQSGIGADNGACDFTYFTLESGDPEKIILGNSPEIPKQASAGVLVTPYLAFDPPPDLEEGTYSEDYELTIDLTDLTSEDLSLLRLGFSLYSAGSAEGLPSNFGTFPAASYSASCTLEVSGPGVSQTVSTSVSYPGGGTGTVPDPEVYSSSDAKTSNLAGPIYPINLLPAVGGVVTVNVHLEANVTPGENGYSEDFSNLSLTNATSIFDLSITCAGNGGGGSGAADCSTVFWTLAEANEGGGLRPILLYTTDEIPKRATATALVSPDVPGTGEIAEGTLHKDYTLTIDLTDPSLEFATGVLLIGGCGVNGFLAGGATSTIGGGPFPNPSFDATVSLEISGPGVSYSNSKSISFAGGGFDAINISDGFNIGFLSLTAAIGGVVTVTIHLEATMNPGSNGYELDHFDDYVTSAIADFEILCG